MTLIYSILGGIFIGSSLGLFGSGGSVLAVPILIYLLKVPTKSAIAMSLFIVGSTALIGAIQKIRQNKICIKAGIMFGGFGIIGSFIGAQVSQYLSATFQLILFAGIMIISSLFLIKNALKPQTQEKEIDTCILSKTFSAILGFLIGNLTGIIGVGGGFLIVPALHFAGLSLALSIGTSLIIIVLNSSAAILGYINHVTFSWEIILPMVGAAILSQLFISYYAKNIKMKKLKISFAVFLLCMGCFITFLNVV